MGRNSFENINSIISLQFSSCIRLWSNQYQIILYGTWPEDDCAMLLGKLKATFHCIFVGVGETFIVFDRAPAIIWISPNQRTL